MCEKCLQRVSSCDKNRIINKWVHHHIPDRSDKVIRSDDICVCRVSWKSFVFRGRKAIKKEFLIKFRMKKKIFSELVVVRRRCFCSWLNTFFAQLLKVSCFVETRNLEVKVVASLPEVFANPVKTKIHGQNLSVSKKISQKTSQKNATQSSLHLSPHAAFFLFRFYFCDLRQFMGNLGWVLNFMRSNDLARMWKENRGIGSLVTIKISHSRGKHDLRFRSCFFFHEHDRKWWQWTNEQLL